MAWKVTADPDRHAEAVKWFRKRTPITKARYEKLSAAAKQQSFTIGGSLQLRVVQAVFDEIARALEAGQAGDEAFSAFKDRLRQRLKSDYVDENSARLRAVFTTTVQTALNTGVWEHQADPELQRKFPYRKFVAVLDAATTHVCRNLNGTVRPVNDKFWLTHWPPLWWNCRSRVLLVRDAPNGISPIPRVDHHRGFGDAPPLRADWEPSAADYDRRAFNEYRRKLARLRQAHAGKRDNR